MDNVTWETPIGTEKKSSDSIGPWTNNEWTSKELTQELSSAPEEISLWQINLDGKIVELTLKLSSLLHIPRPYFLYGDDKSVDYYSKQGTNEILEWGNGVYAKEDIDIDGNTLYMRDGNRRWLKYSIEKKWNDKIALMLKERVLYNPLRSSTKTRTIGKKENITLIEYCNPPERGHIDKNKFGPTEGKLLLLHDRNALGRDKIIIFPEKEWVTFDENTAENYNYEFYIYDTSWKRYRYDINVVNAYLREIDINE